jgi:sodium/potassium-transporting ATPase subunit alpha
LKLLHELTTPFALLLWAGAILCFVAFALSSEDQSNLYLGIVLAVINLMTGIMAFYQNMKSEAIMGSFKDFIPPETIVIRNGEERKIDATKLVVGDVIRVELGKKIPADIRIIDSVGMKVDNSSLTGETELLPRSVDCTDDNPLETKNIAFFSTLNKEGTGKGVVFATGDRTFIGQIANLAANASTEEAPLKKEIKRFIIRLTIFAVSIGLLLFCLGFAVGYPPLLNFIFAIGLITANVPEGMIVEVTVGLTLTAKRLSEKKVLCKNLDAVETLGSTSCICSDKTGTLTMNKMTAAHLWYSGQMFKAANRQKNGVDFNYEYDIKDHGFIALQECAVVCSVANFDKTLPSEKITSIMNDKTLKEDEKVFKIKEEEIQW